MPTSLPKSNVRELLLGDLQRPKRWRVGVQTISKRNFVLKKSAGGTCFLSKVIQSLVGNKHLCFEGHLRDEVTPYVMEQASDVAGSTSLIAHRKRRIHQRVVGQRAQKPDGIQEIGLSDTVRACDTGEWTKAYIDVNEILESRYAEPC